MTNKSAVLTGSILIAISSVSIAHQGAVCGDAPHPLLSVSDFNGDGKVTSLDMDMMILALREGTYYSIYDRNADAKLGIADLYAAKRDMGKISHKTDQQLAKMYQRFKHIQTLNGHHAIMAMNYQPLGGAFAMHGQHWMNSAGEFAVVGLRAADPFIAEGLNVLADGSDVPALFWGDAAVPLFNDSAAPNGLSTLDWPSPTGVWNTERVQAFADAPPDFFPDTTADMWHKHAGLCATATDDGNGLVWRVDQHLSNAECQALPNAAKADFMGQKINRWGNFWMLHVWLYDLNPRGVFGNTHPCIDPDAPSEDEINGGRIVPPYFQDMH